MGFTSHSPRKEMSSLLSPWGVKPKLARSGSLDLSDLIINDKCVDSLQNADTFNNASSPCLMNLSKLLGRKSIPTYDHKYANDSSSHLETKKCESPSLTRRPSLPKLGEYLSPRKPGKKLVSTLDDPHYDESTSHFGTDKSDSPQMTRRPSMTKLGEFLSPRKRGKKVPPKVDDNNADDSSSHFETDRSEGPTMIRRSSFSRLGECLSPRKRVLPFRRKSVSSFKGQAICGIYDESSHREDDDLNAILNYNENKRQQALIKIENAIMEIENRKDEIEDSIATNFELAKYRFQQLDKTSSSLANKIVATNAMGKVLDLEMEHRHIEIVLLSLQKLQEKVKNVPSPIKKIDAKIDRILGLKSAILQDQQDISLLSGEDLLLEIKRRLQ